MATTKLAVTLPLFDASALASAALRHPNAGDLAAVVSTDGVNFWLHPMDELSAALPQHGGPVTFAGLQKHLLTYLTPEAASAANLDLLKPSTDQVKAVYRALGASLVIASIARGLAGDAMAVVLADPTGRFTLVRKKYVCSRFQETYDESVYRTNNGNCPNHQGATLSEQP
jgi:hypothetical protein